MATTTPYKTDPNLRAAQTPPRSFTGDRNEVGSGSSNRVVIGAIIAILAIAALAFALGVFGGSDTDETAVDETVYQSTVGDTAATGAVTTAPANEPAAPTDSGTATTY